MEVEQVVAKERIIAIRLENNLKKMPKYAEKIGISARLVKTNNKLQKTRSCNTKSTI